MATTQAPREDPELSGWAAGGITFAALLLLLAGSFQVVSGLVAVIDDEFFVVTRNYTFDIDTSVWGWIHLVLGVLFVFTGIGLLSRSTWAGVAAIFFAMLSALVNFFFIPYYPIWSIVVIAADVWIIWSITRPGAMKT